MAALAGMKTGNDLDIQKFTSNVNMAPTGLRANNIDLVVPSLGTVVGNGTLDSKNNMDFKLVATVNSVRGDECGGFGRGLTGRSGGFGAWRRQELQEWRRESAAASSRTTANPQFVPDVGGAAASLLKSELSCAGGPGTTGVPTNPSNVVNRLGGLLGKKKP